jgi:uncharacterized protein (DUF1800 family)
MKRTSPVLASVVALAALLAPVAAQQPRRPAAVQHAIPASPDDKAIVHVLNRIGFGPGPGDVEAVRRIGLAAHIEQQLHPERIADGSLTERLAVFTTLQLSTRELADRLYIPALMERQRRQREQGATGQPPAAAAPEMAMAQAERGPRQAFAELAQQKVLRAVYSERQLEEVMVDFWFNHFNVFGGKGPTRMYLTEYERDVIRPHALGRFRDLLQATAQSPAMLFYLDNWQSAAPGDAMMPSPRARGRGRVRPPQQRPTQGRRRDINENYARELMELHTLGVDGGYTQKDVQEVARAFTGWTIRQPRMGGEFRFEPRMHDGGEKVVLGQKIKAGGGMNDGEQVLDLLARHPSTAKFIATKLARRFVADEPPVTLVGRAAARFTETNGDMREVVRAIVTSPEFFAPEAYRAKVKTPLEFVASAVRASGLNLSNAMPAVQALRELGMPPYMCEPPTGYADRAEAWVNTGALLNRMNFAVALTGVGREGRGRARASGPTPPVAADILIKNILAGDLTAATRSTIARAASAPQAIALVLGSPEFQRR